MGTGWGARIGETRRMNPAWAAATAAVVALAAASCTSGTPRPAERTAATDALGAAPVTGPSSTTASATVTSTAPRSTEASAGSGILVYGDCRSPTLEPAEIVLACADYGWVLKDLRWSTWTSTGATAVGTFVYNDCSPNCAAGHSHSVPGTRVTLTAPTHGAGGQLVWSRLTQSPEPPGYATGPYHGGPFPLPTRPV